MKKLIILFFIIICFVSSINTTSSATLPSLRQENTFISQLEVDAKIKKELRDSIADIYGKENVDDIVVE